MYSVVIVGVAIGFDEIADDKLALGDQRKEPLPITKRLALPPMQMEVSSETMGSS
jgi:hypothetical protein